MHVSDRNRLEKEERMLLFASDDMLEARAAALGLQQTEDHHLRWALETALSAAYARAFTSSTLFQLDRDEYRPDDPGLGEVHDLLIDLRDSTYAHTDVDSGREASITPRAADASTIDWSRKAISVVEIP